MLTSQKLWAMASVYGALFTAMLTTVIPSDKIAGGVACISFLFTLMAVIQISIAWGKPKDHSL